MSSRGEYRRTDRGGIEHGIAVALRGLWPSECPFPVVDPQAVEKFPVPTMDSTDFCAGGAGQGEEVAATGTTKFLRCSSRDVERQAVDELTVANFDARNVFALCPIQSKRAQFALWAAIQLKCQILAAVVDDHLNGIDKVTGHHVHSNDPGLETERFVESAVPTIAYIIYSGGAHRNGFQRHATALGGCLSVLGLRFHGSAPSTSSGNAMFSGCNQ